MLDEMFQQNASKFAIFLEYENPRSFFHFPFRATLFFSPNECPGLSQHSPGHSLGEKIKLHEMKNIKTTWVFVFQKYAKF